MKITVKHYAQSLFESVDGKSQAEVRDVLKKFVELLYANNQASKVEKIIIEFEKIWNQNKKIVGAKIVSAKKLDEEMVSLLNSYVSELSGATFIESEENLDKSLLGGVVLKFGDKVMDGSLKARLEDLRERMVK